MNFLHLWALGIGAAALAVPAAIHFLTKPRPVTYPLSTIRFLVEIIEQKRARSRLRDLLVLLLRMLAIGLLAMALARPWLSDNQNIEAIPEDATSRVILLDVSQSMSAKSGSSSALQKAQAIALKYLEYSPNLQANLVLVGAKPRPVFNAISPNLATLRDAARASNYRCERSDIKSAMTLVGSMLAQSKKSKSEMIIISDFQRSNWSNLYLNLIPAETKVLLESVAPESSNNIAITGFRFGNRAIVDCEVMLELDVANYTDQDTQVRATLTLHESTTELRGRVAAQSSATLTTPIKFSKAQWQTGWVELRENSDMIPADDIRPVAFQVEQPPRIVVLTQAKKPKTATGGLYLEQALQVIVGESDPQSRSEKSKELERLSMLPVEQANAQTLSGADIFIVHQCGALEPAVIDQLAMRVRRGKGLLYFASELVDGVNLDLLASAMGIGYQPPVQLIPSESDAKRKDLFVRDVRSRQSPFSIFGEQAIAAMQTTRISGGLASQSLEAGLRDQVVAELSDSSAFLFLTSSDAGRVAVVNADLDQSNWCSQPSFFPVLNELVNTLYASQSMQGESAGGEPLVRQLSSSVPQASLLNIEPADKRSIESDSLGTLEWSVDQNAFTWSWPDPVGPGSYWVRNQSESVMAVSIAAPSVESDPKTLSSDVLQGRLAGSRPIGFRDSQSSDQKSDQWWNWLIVACILGLVSEIVMLRWFSA